MQRPGGDHVVVDGDEGGDEHHGVAHALEERGGLPHGDGTQAGELAERQLHEHQGHSAEHQHHEVGDEERPYGDTRRVTQLVSWCFEPSQPQRIMSGLRKAVIKRCIVERTNKAEIRPKEQSEKAVSSRENL